MTHLLRLDAVAHRDEFAVRLDGHLLGHVVRDPRALTEVWSWWPDGGGVRRQHEDTREMAVGTAWTSPPRVRWCSAAPCSSPPDPPLASHLHSIGHVVRDPGGCLHPYSRCA